VPWSRQLVHGVADHVDGPHFVVVFYTLVDGHLAYVGVVHHRQEGEALWYRKG